MDYYSKKLNMETLELEPSKRACALTLQIREPGDTLKNLTAFFKDRQMVIDNMQMHRYRSGDAMLIVHCGIDRDSVTRTIHLLSQVPGVTKLDWMEAKC